MPADRSRCPLTTSEGAGERPPAGGSYLIERVRGAAAWAGVLLLAGGAHPQAGSDPGPDFFAPGPLWSAPAPDASAWVPRSVAFTGDGAFVWCGRAGLDSSLALYASAYFGADATYGAADSGSGQAAGTSGASALPRAVDAALGPLVGDPRVAAGADASRLFASTQHPLGLGGARSTRIARYDALAWAVGCASASAAPFAPLWSDESAPPTHAPAALALAAHGTVVVRAVFAPESALGPDRVVVDRFDAADGALLARVELGAGALVELAVSADGERVAVLTGTRVVVVLPDGSLACDVALPAGGRALAFAADGARLLVGDGGRVRVLAESAPGLWLEGTALEGVGPELPVIAAFDPTAQAGAIAWWNALSGTGVRLAVHDFHGGALLFESAQAGSPSGWQNLPVGLAWSADGARVAWGLWGVGDDRPEALLFDRGSATPVLALDLPGSALGVALDHGGTRLAVAAKSAHANQFAAHGALHVAATGERDVVLRRHPYATAAVGDGGAPACPDQGGMLALAAHRPGANIAIFAVGVLAAQPIALPGIGGVLAIERSSARLYPRPVDGSGRSDLDLPLPPAASLGGLELAAQVVWRVAGQTEFSSDVARVPRP